MIFHANKKTNIFLYYFKNWWCAYFLVWATCGIFKAWMLLPKQGKCVIFLNYLVKKIFFFSWSFQQTKYFMKKLSQFCRYYRLSISYSELRICFRGHLIRKQYIKSYIIVWLRYVQKCTHWRKWQKRRSIAKIAKLNKNSNEMAKGPFGKWRFWRKWQNWHLIAKIAKP